MTSQWARPLEVSATPTQIPGSLPNTPRERLYSDDFVHSSCRKSACLLTCLHFEISSVLLLKMFFPLNNAISRFSYRQRLYLSPQDSSPYLGGKNFEVLFTKILLFLGVCGYLVDIMHYHLSSSE